jgi:hypothetical protein
LLLRQKRPGERGPQRLAHLFAREYAGFGYLSKQAFASAFKFTIVRNPYDRLVSEFRYRKRNNGRNFREFVQSLPDTRDRHLVAQSEFVMDSEGRLMVEEILRFEALPDCFTDVAQRVFGAPVGLPHANRSQSEVPAEAQETALRRLIYRHYEQDFDLFGYPSGL